MRPRTANNPQAAWDSQSGSGMKLSYKEKIIYVDLFKKYTQVYIYIKLYFYSLVFTPKNKNRFIK